MRTCNFNLPLTRCENALKVRLLLQGEIHNMKLFNRFIEREKRLQLLMKHIEHLNFLLAEQTRLIQGQRHLIDNLNQQIKTLKGDN
jgi:uncharacterized coiled-coil protein SlyX